MNNKALLSIINVIKDAEVWYNNNYQKFYTDSVDLMNNVFTGTTIGKLEFAIQAVINSAFGKNLSYKYTVSKNHKQDIQTGMFINPDYQEDTLYLSGADKETSILAHNSAIRLVDINRRAIRFMNHVAGSIVDNTLICWMISFLKPDSYENVSHIRNSTMFARYGNHSSGNHLHNAYSFAYNTAKKNYPMGYGGGLVDSAPRLTDDKSIEMYRVLDELISVLIDFDKANPDIKNPVINGYMNYNSVALESAYDRVYTPFDANDDYNAKLDKLLCGEKSKESTDIGDSSFDAIQAKQSKLDSAWNDYLESIKFGYVKRLEDYFMSWQAYVKLKTGFRDFENRTFGINKPNRWIQLLDPIETVDNEKRFVELIDYLTKSTHESFGKVINYIGMSFNIHALYTCKEQLEEMFLTGNHGEYVYNKSRLIGHSNGVLNDSTSRAYADGNSVDMKLITEEYIKSISTAGHRANISLPSDVSLLGVMYAALSETHDIQFTGNDDLRVITLPYLVGVTTDKFEFFRRCGFTATPKKEVVNDNTKPKSTKQHRSKGK